MPRADTARLPMLVLSEPARLGVTPSQRIVPVFSVLSVFSVVHSSSGYSAVPRACAQRTCPTTESHPVGFYRRLFPESAAGAVSRGANRAATSSKSV